MASTYCLCEYSHNCWVYQYGYIGIDGWFESYGNYQSLESFTFREYNKKETIKSINDKNAYEYLYRED